MSVGAAFARLPWRQEPSPSSRKDDINAVLDAIRAAAPPHRA